MKKKALIVVSASLAALVVLAGIFVLLINVLGSRPSSRSDVWDDDDDETETSFSSEETEIPTTTTRETQGRDYYENGGYKGMDNYYIIQDQSVDDIIGIYEYYHDKAHTYEISKLKEFDKELKVPAYSQVDSTGNGIFMFYDQILPDEKIDFVHSFNIEGNESKGTIEFSMKMRIHDRDKAMAIYNGFIDRYSAGSIGTEDYNMMGTFDRGVRIKLSDTESKLVCYKRVRDKYDNYYWLIYVSEDY